MLKSLQSIRSNKGKYGYSIFEKLSNTLKNDREIVLTAVEHGLHVLKFISEELKNDREIVLHSVRNNGLSLDHASDNLKNDRQVVHEAISNNGAAFQFASNELQNDREIICETVRNECNMVNLLSNLVQNDRELILLSIKKNPRILQSISNELQSNRDFILECIRINGRCLRFTLPIYHTDVEIVNEAIKQNPFSIYCINISNIDCKNSLLGVVEHIHLKYAMSDVVYVDVLERINDLDVAMKLIETIPLSVHFLDEDIRNDGKKEIYKSTLLRHGYWMKHSEDHFQERIIHGYYSAKIDSSSDINFYRNPNKTNLWKDLEWNEWDY